MSTSLKSATLVALTVFSAGATASLANNANALSGNQDPTSAGYGGSGTTPGYQRGAVSLLGELRGRPRDQRRDPDLPPPPRG